MGLNMICALPRASQSEQAAREKQQKHSRPETRLNADAGKRQKSGKAPARRGPRPKYQRGRGSDPRHQCRSCTGARREVGPSGGSREARGHRKNQHLGGSRWGKRREARGPAQQGAAAVGSVKGEASGLSASWRGGGRTHDEKKRSNKDGSWMNEGLGLVDECRCNSDIH